LLSHRNFNLVYIFTDFGDKFSTMNRELLLIIGFLITNGFGWENSTFSSIPSLNKYITLHPTSGSQINQYEVRVITVRLQAAAQQYIAARQNENSSIYIGIEYEQTNSNQPQISNNMNLMSQHPKNETRNETIGLKNFTFDIITDMLGYEKYYIQIVETTSNNVTSVLESIEYQLVIVRKTRTVDLAFNVAMLILGILNTFAVGCMTDINLVKQVIKRKKQILISTVSQYVVIPLVSTTK